MMGDEWKTPSVMSSEVETSLFVIRKNSERFLDSARNDKTK
ncbi:MAG: hypothetical protein QOI96_184 [Verrucomicrobiota bacterium]|jgi:hypothetical protein